MGTQNDSQKSFLRNGKLYSVCYIVRNEQKLASSDT